MEHGIGVWKIEPRSVGKERTKPNHMFRRKGIQKIVGTKIITPQKYGMVACPLCDGSGRLINKPGGLKEVCLKCGGFGHIKKEN